MFIDYQYSYLVGCLLLFILWLILFIRRKDLRIEMLTMSILATIWLFISGIWFVNTYLETYWNPQYAGILGLGSFFKTIGLKIKGVEDTLFLFSYSGIVAVLYEEILGKKHLKKGRSKNLKFLIIFPLFVFVSLLITKSTGAINIIYGEYLAYLLASIFIWWFRRDLLMHSLVSGMLSAIFFFVSYLLLSPLSVGIIHKFWILNKTSGVFVLGLPFEEILWAFFIGLWVGPSYEFIKDLKDSTDR